MDSTNLSGLNPLSRLGGTTDVVLQARGLAGRNRSAGGAASLFAPSALSLRAAHLNALMDDAGGAQRILRAKQVKSLINEARDVAERALSSTPTLATLTGSAPYLTARDDIRIDHGDSITVSDGHTTATYVHTGGFDVQHFLDTINDTPNLKVKASLTSDRRLRLEATDTNEITIGGTADESELATIGLSTGTTVPAVNNKRQELARAFDTIRDKIDAVKLESEAADDTSPITARTLGIRRVNGDGGGGLQSNSEINDVLADLDRADKTLAEKVPASTSTRLPTPRDGFVASAIQFLADQSNDLGLSEAAESDALDLAARARGQLAQWPATSIVGKPGEPLLRLFV